MRWQPQALIFLLLPALAHCGPDAGDETSPPGEDGPPVARETAPAVILTPREQRGQEVFDAVCWSCHGSAGHGDGPAVARGAMPPPPDLHRAPYPELGAADFEARFAETLAGQDTTLPHMRSVTAIVAEEDFQAALAYLPALVYPAEIPGSALAGGRVYEFRCQACHGQDGRGMGPAASSLVLRPADFTTDTLVMAGNFQALFQRIREGGGQVHGSAMPPWGRLFREGEMWDLVAYVATFQPEVVPPRTP